MHTLQDKILKLAKKNKLNGLSLRGITRALGEKYPQKIKHHLEQLKNKGFILYDLDNRIFKLTSGNSYASDFTSIPILSSANCGQATMIADEYIEGYLKVSKSYIPTRSNKLFAIKAVGNSMNNAKIGENKQAIENGDYIIVDSKQRSPKNNDYVVSIIDEMANIKKFIFDKDNNQIALISESKNDYPPIYIHSNDYANFMISGKVVNVIKTAS